MLISHLIVLSSRTVRPCSPWGGRWIGHWRTTCSTVCSSAPHSKVAERPYRICASRSGNVRHRCRGREAVKVDPRCSWQRYFRRGCRCRDKSAESRGVVQPSAFHRWSAQNAALLLLSDKLMNCCGAGASRCLDLRCRALPLDGQVSADVQAPCHGVLETMSLFCDEAGEFGCQRESWVVHWCRTQASSHSS